MRGQLQVTAPEVQNAQVMHGFLNDLQTTQPGLVSELLDLTLHDEALAAWFPSLQTAVPVDDVGVERLMTAVRSGIPPRLGRSKH